ncbi:uncharacterized protein N7511_004421 [Penicillium nucicola]|uniref:uncharacterized protein n=1 Tax=Penicillium nucicola TaxID=1850975 RepID=UPI0025452BB8|nr:uncharacterized protein N7511_004421 [Penicillium nucicola]KAJ5766805.1 hypothetical protein N7511_004421 [Penicillium nucicola]
MKLNNSFFYVFSAFNGLGGYAHLLTVPTTTFTETGGDYDLSRLSGIVIDSKYADSVDNNGQTLIPPTLQQFTETFQGDLKSTLDLDLKVSQGNKRLENTIFVTLANQTDFHDVAGRFTSEAYALTVDDQGIVITGASSLGAWWGTRSVIQAAIIGELSLAKGSGADAPGWGTRGAMVSYTIEIIPGTIANEYIQLDVGRKYHPPEFLIEMCSYLSFFKQNTFHVHLDDNLYNNVDIYSTERSMDLYATFRLWSDDEAVAGLNRRANESYTREQFDHVQAQCAQRGVTIIPEIEAPGHALVIVQWKPELGLDDLSMLNISHPDTIPTMKTIWRTFLPWFQSKIVHIGADEYDSDLVSDYTHFVNEMNTFIQEESSGRQQMRIWGTFTPKQGANVSKSVTYQHWDVSADKPYSDYIQNGYNVLNSDDYMYLVGGWSGSFAQKLELSKIFQGPYGAPFSPNIFDSSNKSDNPPRNNPRVLGHAAALWNDYGPNSTTVLQTYYSWRDALPALADKQWGGNITEGDYASVFDRLQAAVPAQNLDRRIPSKSDTILHYTFDRSSDIVTDHSGNGYNGKLHGCKISGSTLHFANGCYLETPLGSKGRDYTLSFKVKPTSHTPGSLFNGPDSSFVNGNGTISNVTLISGGNPYSLNYTLPLNTWTDVSLIGRGNATLLTVSGSGGGSRSMEFLTKIGVNGEYFVWAPIAIEAPLTRIGEGFTGSMKEIMLKGSA